MQRIILFSYSFCESLFDSALSISNICEAVLFATVLLFSYAYPPYILNLKSNYIKKIPLLGDTQDKKISLKLILEKYAALMVAEK